MIKILILASIRFYQKFLSFDTGLGRILVFSQPVCRHSPSCSQYTYNMVQRHGVVSGLWLGFNRVLNCR